MPLGSSNGFPDAGGAFIDKRNRIVTGELQERRPRIQKRSCIIQLLLLFLIFYKLKGKLGVAECKTSEL